MITTMRVLPGLSATDRASACFPDSSARLQAQKMGAQLFSRNYIACAQKNKIQSEINNGARDIRPRSSPASDQTILRIRRNRRFDDKVDLMIAFDRARGLVCFVRHP